MGKENVFQVYKKRLDLRKKRKANFKLVREATGWNKNKTLQEMGKAKEKGLPYYKYVKYECWKLNDEEIHCLIENLEKISVEKESKKIGKLCKKTGWTREKAVVELSEANALGISTFQYTNKNLFELSRQELIEFSNELEKRRKIRKADNEFYIDIACKKTGWDRETAISRMNEAKDKGVSYLKFVQKDIWKDDKKTELVIKFINNDKKRIKENKKRYIGKICEATGWSVGKAELEVLKAKNVCGASYEDFYAFKLYEKDAKEQQKYVTIDMFNKMRLKYNDHSISAQNFDDKSRFNENFNDLIKHKWFINKDLSYEDFLSNIKDLKKLIIKPLAATQGIGIEVVCCNESEEKNKALYEHITELELSIIEEYIVQHEALMQFCPSSVNTIRVMTLNYQGMCRFLYSVFRMGRDGVVDNFHAGGVAATIDLETGIVVTNAADLDGNVFTHSPSTGVKIKGFQVPYWDKIREACEKATGRIEGTNLVGWDFAVTAEGVDLIEGNPGASYVVAQIPNIEDKIGLAEVMAIPYL